MVIGIWGKKIGMTQVFSKDKVVPVTVLDVSHWYVTGIKTKESDGYTAIQVGRLKDRYVDKPFSLQWLKKLTTYFDFIREIKADEQDLANYTIGKPFKVTKDIIAAGAEVDVSGVTKGCGFAGVIRRHGFSGGPASHGSSFGRAPGSIGFMTACGRVIKGKKLPGRMGGVQRMMRNLEVIEADVEPHIMLVKGSIPGKTGTLVFIRKSKR